MDDLKYWVALHRVSGLGPVRFGKLEARFGSLAEAWRAGRADLASAGLDAKVVEEVIASRSETDPNAEMQRLDKAGVRACHRRSPDYPALLARCPDAPSVIYLKGALLAADQRAVAVVGTRGSTVYGKEMARRLSYDLAAAGVTVVSGLARGIDGIAHQSAIDAGGRTVAVMGGGLDSIYPPEHTTLAARIMAQGAVVSEYPLGMRPRPEHFPRRNRVISGMALGTLVVEADMDSGAMITVRWALEQDREVFAVPGSALSPKSNGPNWLIQQGAKLVSNYQDVLEELNIAEFGMAARPEAGRPAAAVPGPGDALPNNRSGRRDRAHVPVNRDDAAALDGGVIKEEGMLLAALAGGPAHVDDLTRSTGLSPATVSSVLTVLELQGAVRQVGPMQFARDIGRPGAARGPWTA